MALDRGRVGAWGKHSTGASVREGSSVNDAGWSLQGV